MGKDAAEFVICDEEQTVVEWSTLEGALEPDDIFAEMDRLIAFWNVDAYDIAYDVDGLGWALINRYDYAKKIKNNGTPLFGENYSNYKTQLYFRLSRNMNAGKMALNCWTQRIEDELTKELNVLQRIKIDTDGKITMTDKATVKAQIGRSPNKSDVLAYQQAHFMEDLDQSYIIF